MRETKKEKNLIYKKGRDGLFGWHIVFDYRENGKRKKIRAFGAYTKEEARSELERLRKEKREEKAGTKTKDILFEDFVKEKSAIFNGGKRAKTQQSYRTSLNHFFNGDGFFKGKRFSEITSELIAEYKAKRASEISEPSVNRELALLKLLFRSAQEWGFISSNPAAKIKLFKENNTRIRILSEDEQKHLIEAAANHLKPIIVIALNTAMRKNEIRRLRWSFEGYKNDRELADSIVDLKQHLIFIPGKLAKNHEDREIPLSPFLIEFFKGLKSESKSDYVFGIDFRRSFGTALKKAQIKGATIHTLRHTAISKMVDRGIDLVTVAEIAGHKDIKTTMRYCHPTNEKKLQAIEVLSERLVAWRQVGDIVEIPSSQIVDYKQVN
jgi:integrase